MPNQTIEEKISIIKNIIDEIKLLGDEDQLAYWETNLNRLQEEQLKTEDIKLKQQEKVNEERNINVENKEIIQVEDNKEKEEEKKEENKEIEATATKGNTTMTKYKDGNIRVDSDYIGIKVQANNPILKIKLEELLMTITTDEISGNNKFADRYIELLKQAKSQQDINDMLNFLKSISTVGVLGQTYDMVLTNYTEHYIENVNGKRLDAETTSKEKEEDITKKLEMLDMQLDEISNGRTKDPDDYRKLATEYQKQADKLEQVLETTVNETKREELEKKIKDLQKKSHDLIEHAENIEKIAINFQF